MTGKEHKNRFTWGSVEFLIWQEDGKVKQEGLNIPETIDTFQNTKHGRLEAGAYICGIRKGIEIVRKYLLGK